MIQVFNIRGQADIDPLTGNNGATINEMTALTIPAVYRGVSFIAQTIAHLPKRVYHRQAGSPQHLENHPIEWTLNDEPSDLATPATFWATFLLHAIVWSNGYAAIKTGNGDTQLFNLPPDRMIPFRYQGQQWYAYDLEQPQDPSKPNSRYLIFSAAEILHLPALSFDGQSGLGLIRLMAGTLKTSKSTEHYVGKYYAQGGLMGGVIESDAKLTVEQITDLTNLVNNKYSGSDNAHKWMILGNGATAKTLSPQLDTAQTSENRQFSVLEIARMLGVPPYLLFDLTRATWANIEFLGIEVVKYTLNNWIVPLEQEITRKLLTRQERKNGTYVRFDVSALLRGDHAAQIDAAVKRSSNGLTTVDEERASIELPPYADGIGSRPRVPANTVGLGNASPAAPAAPGEAIGAAPAASQPTTAPAADPEDVEASDDLQAKPTAEPFAVKGHLNLAHFEAMIDDAAGRVHTKTQKATEAAQRKHAGNPQAWTVWSNIFTQEQEHFAAATIAPVFTTYQNLSGKDCSGMAHRCGATYGRGLGGHLMSLGHGQESTAPDLKAIVMGMPE